MLKCGSCRVKGSDCYSKITNGHMLYDILIKLNPTIVYNNKNAYFCDKCIDVATKKFDDGTTTMSDQNAIGLSVANSSFTTTETTTISDLKVSSDEEASHFALPDPKRFKQQAACIIPGSELNRIEQETTSSNDSESLSDCDVLLYYNRDVSVEHSIVVEDISNFTGSVEGDVSVQEEQHSVVVEDISASVEGSIAPVARNSRIREPNVHLTGDVQAYLQENQVAINVNNYSRSLAG